MNNWLISIGFGGVLIVVGLVLMRSNVRTWRGRQYDPGLEPLDRKHYYAQYRRRMQTSALLVLLGILIPGGDLLLPARQAPGFFAIYWIGVLLLASWVILLGLGDLFSVSAHSRVELSRVRQKQRALEEQLARIKQQRSNGNSP